MAVQLGKITREHDLRTVWSNEAQAFTPWLAEHLDVLGDALGITIELEERESSVGAFSLDILARDQDSGEAVVIENQIEQSDHEHLGKLITYASGKDAKYIVWIVKDAREELTTRNPRRSSRSWNSPTAGQKLPKLQVCPREGRRFSLSIPIGRSSTMRRGTGRMLLRNGLKSVKSQASIGTHCR